MRSCDHSAHVDADVGGETAGCHDVAEERVKDWAKVFRGKDLTASSGWVDEE